jgi:hypothetical protein
VDSKCTLGKHCKDDKASFSESDNFLIAHVESYLAQIQEYKENGKCALLLISGDADFRNVLKKASLLGVHIMQLANLDTGGLAKEYWQNDQIGWIGDWDRFVR